MEKHSGRKYLTSRLRIGVYVLLSHLFQPLLQWLKRLGISVDCHVFCTIIFMMVAWTFVPLYIRTWFSLHINNFTVKGKIAGFIAKLCICEIS